MPVTSPYLTQTGLAVPTLSEWVVYCRDTLAADLGITVDWTSDLVLSHIVNLVALPASELSDLGQALYDAYNPATAGGVHLDNIASLNGLERNAATASSVTLTLTVDKATTLERGDQVQGGTSDTKARWELSEQVVFTGAGSQDVVATCITTGPITALAGTITTIVNTRDGWTGVTNAAAATPGTDEESDAALRIRRAATLQRSGSTTPAALRARLLLLDGVQSAAVLSNPEGFAQTIEGKSLPPRSIAVVLYPDTLTTDQETEVAKTIFQHSVAGIEQVGAETKTVQDSSGVEQTVAWDYATSSPQNVTASLTLAAGYTLAGVTPEAESKITSLFSLLQPGEDLRTLAITCALGEVEGIIGVSLTTPAADVSIPASQVATEGTVTLT